MVETNRLSVMWTWMMTAAIVWCASLSSGALAADTANAQADGGEVLRLDTNHLEVNLGCDWLDSKDLNEFDTHSAMLQMVDGHPRFVVVKSQAEAGHLWYSRWFNRPVDIKDEYPILVLTYRATGFDTTSRDYAISIKDGKGYDARHHFRPLLCKAVVSDGQVHTFRQDLRKVRNGRPEGPVLQLGVAVWADDKGKASFELLSVAFERDPEAPAKDRVDSQIFKKDQPVVSEVMDFKHQPLAGAKVSVNTMIKGFEQDAMTDTQGRVSIAPWTNEQREYWLTITHEGMVPAMVSVKPGEPVRVRLAEARSISGDVVDDLGKPVSGAIVQFMHNHGEVEVQLPPGQWQHWPKNVMTDENGRWSQDGFARDWRTVSAVVWHPDVVRPYFHPFEINQPNVVQLDGLEATIAPVHIVAHNGWSITGKVLDAQVKPLQDAKVYVGRYEGYYFKPPVAITDEQGVFHVKQLVDPQTFLTAIKPGHGPVKLVVDSPKDWQQHPQDVLVTQDLKMSPPGTVRFRVVDGQGKPIAGVAVNAASWGEFKGKMWSAKTNKHGQAQWQDAPIEPVHYTLYKNKISQDVGEIAAGPTEHVLVMQSPMTIQGNMVDAVTGKPIDQFIVRYATPKPTDHAQQGAQEIPIGVSAYRWQEHEIIQGQDGKYSLTIKATTPKRYLRFHALGYEPFTSREINASEGSISFDVKMTPGKHYNGVVLTPQGKPAVGATVFGVESAHGVTVYTGPMLQLLRDQSGFSAETDARGVFVLNQKMTSEKFVAVGVIHESGYMEFRGDAIDHVETIKLRPWVTLSGVSRIGSEPERGGQINAMQLSNPLDPAAPGVLVKETVVPPMKPKPRANLYVDENGQEYYRPDIRWSSQVKTDNQGRFEMKLPAGGYEIGRMVLSGNVYELFQAKLMRLKAGVDVKDVKFGGIGRAIQAKLVWKTKPQLWKHARVSLIYVPDENAPISVVPLSDDQDQGPDLESLESGYALKRNGPVVKVDEYNMLRGVDVEPGAYDMQVWLYEKDWPENGRLVGEVQKRIVITTPPDGQAQGDQTVDLGELEIQPPE